jgi:membrane associated rhomboid family serine protease
MTELDAVCQVASRRSAEERVLVLASAGLRAVAHRAGDAWLVLAASPDLTAAREVLATWERENAPRPASPDRADHGSTWVGVWTAAVLLALHALAGPLGSSRSALAGAAHARKMLAGEWWRALTALTLHVDLPHVAGNALAALVFGSYLGHRIGPGVALGLAVAAGTLGNVANALYHGPSHRSVGASTALFGVIGVLAGIEAASRWWTGQGRRRAWLPLAAGIALLAMLGTGRGSDVGAHAFGLAFGALLGLTYGMRSLEPARASVQLTAGLGVVLALLLGWALALGWIV